MPSTLASLRLLGLRPTETAGEWNPVLVMSDPNATKRGTAGGSDASKLPEAAQEI